MERRRITRYLRIAVTALSLTACVLLLALWALSYIWYTTVWCGTRHTSVFVQSLRGEYQLGLVSNPYEYDLPNVGIRFNRVSGEYSDNSDVREFNWGGFWMTLDIPDGYYPGVRHSFIGCRHWLLVIVFAALAAAPWIRWSMRFSLRTLLIATTLVAVGLGIFVALSYVGFSVRGAVGWRCARQYRHDCFCHRCRRIWDVVCQLSNHGTRQTLAQ
jgi:hypothetical protein